MRTDEELIAGIVSGDNTAFQELHSRHEFGIRAYIARNYREEDNQIDDLLQRIWVRVWRFASKYRAGENKVFTWIWHIAKGEISRELKKADSQERAESVYKAETLERNPDMTDTSPPVLDRLLDREEHETQLTLLQAAAMLRGPDTVRVIDGILAGKTQREVAKEVGLGKTRVDQLIQRAKNDAKNLLTTGQGSLQRV